MSTELNSTIDVRSSSTCTDTHGSDPIAGNESKVPVTPIPLKVGSVCGSDAAEPVASEGAELPVLGWGGLLWI